MTQKTIALPASVSLVIASMVGIGVFTSVGFQVASLPSAFPILVLWAVGGVVSLCGALCYAELVAMMPRSGGEYHLLRESFHPLAGFLAGWVSVTAGFAAPITALGMAFGQYAQGLGASLPPNVMASVAIIAIALLHLSSLRVVGGFLSCTTLLKVALISAFVVAAVVLARTPTISLLPKAGDMDLMLSPSFATSMVYVMFAYSGWNGAAYVAGEVRDPQKLIPRAFVLGVLIVCVLYIALNAVFLARVPWDAMDGQVEAGLIASEAMFGMGAGKFMGALIAFGIISTLAGYTWAGSRVIQRMGQDYPRLRLFARENRWGAPHMALLLQTAFALIMLSSGTFDAVVNYLTALLQLCSLVTVLAVIVLRWRRPDAVRPFKVPLYPLTPILFIAVSIWMLVYVVMERPVESAMSVLTLCVGAGIYAWVSRPQRSTRIL